MPYKDPAAKKAYMRKWREHSIGRGYGKWLYDRRALRFSDAEHFRDALEKIRITCAGSDAAEIALAALQASEKRWDSLGPAPGGAHINASNLQVKRPDDTLLEALEKLGLASDGSES